MIRCYEFNLFVLPFANVGINDARTNKFKKNWFFKKHDFFSFVPDWGLFEANNDADIDFIGIGDGLKDAWGRIGVVGSCSIGASKRWICKM